MEESTRTNLFSKYGATALVFLLALVFFLATSSYNYLTQDSSYRKWNSPDETANYFFASRLATTGQITSFERINLVAHDLVHPRSMRSDQGWLKPVSFLGIVVIYGYLGQLFDPAIIPFLTPFFGALGILALYGFASRFFSKRVGVISAFLLASFPVYIFYSVRSMFHNVLFTVFLLVFAWLLSLAWDKKRDRGEKFLSVRAGATAWKGNLFSFLAGWSLGTAVFIRTSELIWLGPVLGLLWLFNIRRFGLSRLLYFLPGLVLGLLPMAYFNQILFGSPIFGGYTEMNRSLAAISEASGQIVSGWSASKEFFLTLFNNVFYFGFKPHQSLLMFKHYAVDMFPILFWLSCLGGVLLSAKNFFRFRKRDLLYLSLLLIGGAILVFYYGSWKFYDNPNVSRYTIGNSYTRYWLPIYAFALPLAALSIASLARTLSSWLKGRSRKVLTRLISVLAVGAISYWSLMFVVFGSEEGLIHLYNESIYERSNVAKLLDKVDEGAIVVTQYHDKYLFPERRVLVGLLSDNNMNYYYGLIAKLSPLYYYNFTFRPEDIIYLNEQKLPPFGLRIEPVTTIDRAFTLYRLLPFNSEKDGGLADDVVVE